MQELHDWRCWLGGGKEEKRRADRAFREGIKDLGGLRHWLRAWRWYLGLRFLSWGRLGWFAWSNKTFHWGGDRLEMGLAELHGIWREEERDRMDKMDRMKGGSRR